MLTVLARRCGWLAPDEREAIFHDAYALMLEKERDGSLDPLGMHSNQLRAYLTQAAINKALNEGTRAERNRTEPIGERALAEPDLRTAPDEAAASALEGAVVREIVNELPPRRKAVIKLRFFFERKPDEIQRSLDITARVYRRELERGIRHICERFELVRTGAFCETRKSLIMAFVAGTAEEDEEREAREHLSHCTGCSHWAAELRERAKDVAAVLPVPTLAMETGSGSRLADAAGAVHDAATNLVAATKHQAASLVARLDPGAAGYATAARPGTIAVVASCIAAGGGATYCAVQGVGELPGFFEAKRSAPIEEEHRGTVNAAEAPRPGQSVNATVSPVPSPARPVSDPGQDREADPRIEKAEAAATEFGIDQPTESSTPTPDSATPAPAPPTSSDSLGGGLSSGAPSEFDP